MNNLHDVNVRTLNGNKMWVVRSETGTSASNYCEACPRRERNIEIVSKSPRHASWWNDNEAKRKRRVAKYKLYAAEGKLKSSLKKRFRSIKVTCMKIVTSL